MMVMMADSRGQVRRSRLERASRLLTMDAPFRALDTKRRAMLIHEQTLIATFAPERALEGLTALLPDPADRLRAAEAVQWVAGPQEEMAEHTRETLAALRRVLGLAPLEGDVTEDPFADAA